MRKTICDGCKKEIGINDKYVSLRSVVEELQQSRRVDETDELELGTYCFKCAKKLDIKVKK